MLTPSPSQAIIRVIVAISPGGFAVAADAADNVTPARSALQMIGRIRFMAMGRLVDGLRRFRPPSLLVAPERRKFNQPGWLSLPAKPNQIEIIQEIRATRARRRQIGRLV